MCSGGRFRGIDSAAMFFALHFYVMSIAMKIHHSTRFSSFLLATSLSLFGGCGSSTESTVIQPTEDYQPTEQEQLNESHFEELRDQQQPSI